MNLIYNDNNITMDFIIKNRRKHLLTLKKNMIAKYWNLVVKVFKTE